MKKATGEKPLVKGMQYHIHCKKGDLSRYILIPGDPWRVPKIAANWTNAKKIAFYREYQTYTGYKDNVPISICSSGIGGSSLAIAIEELLAVGVDTFIRVGTTGAIQPNIQLGDFIISAGAVRLDGASKDYIMPEFPAIADYNVVLALIKAAQKLKVRYHVGITASTDTFYGGQSRKGHNGYIFSEKENLITILQKANVLNFEMEAATLFTLASIFKARAGAICVVVANRVKNEFKITEEMEKKCGEIATEAIKILFNDDKRI